MRDVLRIYYIILLALLFLMVSPFAMAMENYCQDPESWERWDKLIEKHPEDKDIHILHALRLGLCAKIERGDLTVEEATDIFESARNAIIKKKSLRTEKESGL